MDDGHHICGFVLKNGVVVLHTSTQIFVGNLAITVHKDMLKKLFKEYGVIGKKLGVKISSRELRLSSVALIQGYVCMHVYI